MPLAESMIQNITIENFRQFDYIEVNDLKRVNFFVGKNNCGKTSVLEAILWICNPIDLYAIPALRQIRNITVRQEEFPVLFHNKDTSKTLKMSINTALSSLSIEMARSEEPTNHIISRGNEQKMVDFIEEFNYSIKNKTDEKHGKITNIGYSDKTFELGLQIPSTQAINITILNRTFISDRATNSKILEMLNEIKNYGYEAFIQKLQIFDSSIIGVEFGLNNTIQIQTKQGLFSFGLMGDGFQKYFKIIVELSVKNIKVALIDEIENGLHHTTQRELLRAILKLSREKDIQMFITTHSLETLKFLSEIMQEKNFQDDKEDAQVVKLVNTKLKGFLASNYTIDEIQGLIDNDSEVRGQ